MIFIYKELIKKYLTKITPNDIKAFAVTKNEMLTDDEANIIYNHMLKYQDNLLNKDTKSFTILKEQIRPNLFVKVTELYEEAMNTYSKYL